jgi:hypothetical protein
MDIDETKLFKKIEQDTSPLKDYKAFLKVSEELHQKKQQKKLIWKVALLLVYLSFSFIYLFLFRNNPSIIFWPVKTSSSEQEISDIQLQIDSLKKEISNLRSVYSSSSDNVTIKMLEKRIGGLEDAIFLDPEKALTAVLLREKQKNLETNFSELRNTQSRIEGKLDSFITTVIFVPLFGGLIAWFVQSRFKKED